MSKRIILGALYGGKYSTAAALRTARNCEDWGYDYYWHSDERFFRDPYAGLAICAMETSRIKLGVAVTDPYSRHPALTAMGIATVDEVSEGRAVLGIGSGVSGLLEMGMDTKHPNKAIRETIDFVRQFMTNQHVTYNGEIVQFTDGVLSIPGRANLPIYIAGKGPLNIQLAGQVADGLIISSCVADATIEQTLAYLAKGAAKAGRNPADIDLASRVNISIDDDGALARQAVRPMLALLLISKRPDFSFIEHLGLTMSPELTDLVNSTPYSHEEAVIAPVANAIPDDIVDALAVAGAPDEVARSIKRMAAKGVTQFLAYPMPTANNSAEDVLRRLATEVMPLVQPGQIAER